MLRPADPPPRWPARLGEAVIAAREAPLETRPQARSRLWPLLHAALFACLRSQAGRIAPVHHDDLEDLASQKALELVLRAEQGTWDPTGRAEHDVAGYVHQVARHALVDLARRRGRECPAPFDEESWSVALEDRIAQTRPEDLLSAREFARALRTCVETLAPRARQAWFQRVFLERPSREIGAALRVAPGHVDVIVQRARAALRQCMEAKGHRDADMRPGAFVEIWACLSREPLDGLAEEATDERD